MFKLTDNGIKNLKDNFVFLPISNLKFYFYSLNGNPKYLIDLYDFLNKIIPIYNSLKEVPNETHFLRKIFYLIFLNIEKNFSKSLYWDENEKYEFELIASDFEFFLNSISAPDLPIFVISFLISFITFDEENLGSVFFKCKKCEKEFDLRINPKNFLNSGGIKFFKNKNFQKLNSWKKISETYISKNKKIEIEFKIRSINEFLFFAENYLNRIIYELKNNETENSISEINNPFFPIFLDNEILYLIFFTSKITVIKGNKKIELNDFSDISEFYINVIPVNFYNEILNFFKNNFFKKYFHEFNYSSFCPFCGADINFEFNPLKYLIKKFQNGEILNLDKLFKKYGDLFIKIHSLSEQNFSGLFDLLKVPNQMIEEVIKGVEHIAEQKRKEFEKLKKENERKIKFRK